MPGAARTHTNGRGPQQLMLLEREHVPKPQAKSFPHTRRRTSRTSYTARCRSRRLGCLHQRCLGLANPLLTCCSTTASCCTPAAARAPFNTPMSCVARPLRRCPWRRRRTREMSGEGGAAEAAQAAWPCCCAPGGGAGCGCPHHSCCALDWACSQTTLCPRRRCQRCPPNCTLYSQVLPTKPLRP
jgi:hypothetical protein